MRISYHTDDTSASHTVVGLDVPQSQQQETATTPATNDGLKTPHQYIIIIIIITILIITIITAAGCCCCWCVCAAAARCTISTVCTLHMISTSMHMFYTNIACIYTSYMHIHDDNRRRRRRQARHHTNTRCTC